MSTTTDAASPWRILRALNFLHVRLLAVVVVITIVWSLSLTGLSVMRAELEAVIAQAQHATVQQLARDLDQKLHDRLDGLAGIAVQIDANRINDASYLRDFLASRYVLQQSFSGGTAVVGLEGVTIADYPVVPERKGLNYADRDYFRQAVATRQPYIGKPAIGRALGQPVLFMSAPVLNRRGEVKAVMVGLINIKSQNFLGLFGESGRIGAAEVYLMTLKDDLFIVASEDKRVLSTLPAPGSSSIMDRLRTGFEGSMVEISSEGKEKLVSVQRVPTTGWLLELATPTEIIFKPVRHMQAVIIFSGLVVTALSLLLIQYVWLRFFVPLRAATLKLEAMTSGHETQMKLAEEGGLEVRSLCTSFNRLFARIEAQEALISGVVDSTNNLIWSVDAESYELQTFNASFRDYFENNLSRRVEKGICPEDLWSTETADHWRGFYRQALADAPYSVEYGPDAGGIVMRLNFHLLDLDGKVFGISVFAEDITERRKTEEELRQHRIHLERLVKERTTELTDAMKEAEMANNAKSRFLAAASHDLRQPLSALSIYINLLTDQVAPSAQKYVASMKECLAGLSQLLNDLLDLSKLSAGVVKVNVDDFPLADLLDRLQSVHRPVAEAKGLRLRCVPTRLAARTDPVLFQRILGNFIDNALCYTEQGGVVVGCRRRQGKVFVEVWDSGIGIPADKTSEIFEEFRQLGDEARNSGSGLGLAIAAKAAALLGLQIEVRSQPGRGSVFAIELPLGEAEARYASSTFAPAYRALRIALVEDNRLVREALASALQEAGHHVVSAASGDELLAALGSLPPDAIVSDYRLSKGLTGFDAISSLRARFGEALPAIIISGDTDPALLRQMTEHGIVVLHKPLDLEELQAYLEDMTYPATTTAI